jgi:flagellar hook-basal body complex protein FliE
MSNDLIIRNSLKAALNPGLIDRSPKDQVEEESFGAILKKSISEVNNLQNEADNAIQQFATGQGKSIHETIIALEKADVSFKLLVEVRNKLVEAYQEIMRMQI